MPATFSMARVLLLANHLDAESISETRPITISPLAHRLCGRAFFLGGGCWRLVKKGGMGVLTTDVVKMFNAARPAAAVPAATTNVWISHLCSMKRYLRVKKTLRVGHTSTVGILEGDALSVMVATLFGVAWCAAIRARDGGTAAPTAYIDNLDVVAKSGKGLEYACEVQLKNPGAGMLDSQKTHKPSLTMERTACGTNLGAAMTDNKHPLNGVQAKRIQSVYVSPFSISQSLTQASSRRRSRGTKVSL